MTYLRFIPNGSGFSVTAQGKQIAELVDAGGRLSLRDSGANLATEQLRAIAAFTGEKYGTGSAPAGATEAISTAQAQTGRTARTARTARTGLEIHAAAAGF